MQTKAMRLYEFSSELLVALRKNKKLDQKGLADLCGLSQGAISNYERGRMPDYEALTKIGKALGVHFVADWSGSFSIENDPFVI